MFADQTNAPEPSPLPGPKKKQAEALRKNVEWLAKTFGRCRIGFLTLTVGDWVDGKFVKVTDRAEASRRFNSLLGHVIRRRYRCGIVVMERHKDGGIHYHLIVVAPGRIRRGFRWDDFDKLQDKVKRGIIKGWGADAVGACRSLREEWRLWRKVAERFGFGRCEILPMRKTGEALGCYAAKYVSKSWETRRKEDKGARLVRYFGKWETRSREKKILRVRASRGEFCPPRLTPHFTANFGRMTPLARLFREKVRQVAFRVGFDGITITPETVKHYAGQRWAWHWMKKFSQTRFMGSRRLADVAIDFEADDMATLERCGDLQFGIHIADTTRGAGFWQFVPTTSEPDLELHRQRRENRRMVDLDLAMEDFERWRRGEKKLAHEPWLLRKKPPGAAPAMNFDDIFRRRKAAPVVKEPKVKALRRRAVRRVAPVGADAGEWQTQLPVFYV